MNTGMNETIDDVVSHVVQDINANNAQCDETKEVDGGFTVKELNDLKREYQVNQDPYDIFDKICEKLFRKEHIRSVAQLNPDANDEDKQKIAKLRSNFFKLQSAVIMKPTTKKTKVKHKKGEFKRDKKNDPIARKDGKGYETYDNDESEILEKTVYVPAWDIVTNPGCCAFLKNQFERVAVSPDFNYLRQKTCSNVDFNRGIEIIRWLTNYYEFEELDKFVDRFSLFICNAKSRVLNQNPEWGVMFSLVGKLGSGKSWFADMLIKTHDELFETQSTTTRYDSILGRFNGPMLTRGFVHLEEKNGADSKQRETLKTYITDATIQIERKGLDPITARNMTTLLSTTNESILNLVGLQQDRRIIEFNLVSRKTDGNGERVLIPENEMEEKLRELWLTMPCEHPYPTKIVNELLDESTHRLECSMTEIVYTLFQNYETMFLNDGGWVKLSRMREAIKDMGGVRVEDVINWCKSEGILTQQTNGNWYRSKNGLDNIRARAEQYMKEGGNVK